jgi:hypothetical protein
MPYVHLANGDVKQLSHDDLQRAFELSGSPRAYRENGTEHTVIGVYPDEVEYEMSEAEKGDAAESAQYAEWKRSRNEVSE